MLRSPVERHSGGKAPSLARYMQACDHAAASADPGWAGNILGGTLALCWVSLCVRAAEEMGSLQAVKKEGSAGTPGYFCTTERKLPGLRTPGNPILQMPKSPMGNHLLRVYVHSIPIHFESVLHSV